MRTVVACLAVATALSARGACVERPFVPNVPAVTTFQADASRRTTGGVAADYNGDGVADVAVIGDVNWPGSGAILFGTSSGRMIPRPLEGSIEARFIAAADFNGDGKPDLAMADASSIVIRTSNGDGTFGPEHTIVHASGNETITGLAAGDVNGDGRADLLVAGGSGLTTYLGHGDGTFTAGPVTPMAGNRYELAIGDFDHDGRLDVAAASGVDSVLVIARGNGDGTFTVVQQKTFVADAKLEVRVVAADFDGDGRLDLAVANGEGLRILHGAGDGTFADGPLVPLDWELTWGEPRRLVAADLNGDGLPDLLAVESWGIAPVTHHPGHSRSPPIIRVAGENIPFAIQSLPIDAFTSDLDGDGWPDLIELDALGFTSVLMNGCGGPLILRTSADAVVTGEPFTLRLYDASGSVETPATFRDGVAVLGAGAGSLTTSLQTAGLHLLTATAAGINTPALAITVHDHPSSITLVDSRNHSTFGEGIHLSGTVVSDTGEAPPYGNVEILQGSTVLATTPVTGGRYDVVINPLPNDYQFAARYAGAGRWVRSDPSAVVAHQVDVAVTTLTITGLTAGALCQYKFPPRLNGSWGFQVNVAAAFGTPAGSVTILFPRLQFGQTQFVSSGQAGFGGFSGIPPGAYTLLVTYSGDAGYLPSQITATITVPDCHRRASGH
jgi:hypothetical protein